MTTRRLVPLCHLLCALLAGACVSKAPPTEGIGDTGGMAGSTSGRGGSTPSGAGGTSSSGGTSGETGAGGTGSMPPPTGSEPLPETTFAFLRDIREGTTWKATHLYSIDLNTKTERLITTFPESGGTSAPFIAGLAVSPDRRQIAFGSGDFRPSFDDKNHPFKAGILWAVSSDGQTFTRLTPPITEDYHMGGFCGPGSGFCGYGEDCQHTPTGMRCIRPDLTITYGYPAWSTDGKTVFFSQTLSWICAGSNLTRPCWFGWLRSASGGQLTGLATDGSTCTGQVPDGISPSGDLLIHRTSCESMSGIQERDPTTLMPKRLLVKDSPSPFFKTWSPRWLPGASTLIFIAEAEKFRPSTPRRNRRSAIYTWTETGGVKPLFEPSDELSDPAYIAISKTGKTIVEMAHQQPPNETTDLYEFDPATGTLGAKLTNSGTSHTPRW